MQTINLMPAGYAENARARHRLVITAGVLVAVVLAMFGASRLMDKWALQQRKDNVILQEEAAELERTKQELADCNQQLRDLAARFSVVRTLGQNRRWARCLAKIAGAVHGEVVLTRAQLAPPQAAVDDSGSAPGKPTPAPAANENEVRDFSKQEKLVLLIEGYALNTVDVTRFIAALNETHAFERVTFKGSQTETLNNKSLTRFELECPIRYAPREPKPEDKPEEAEAVASRADTLAAEGRREH